MSIAPHRYYPLIPGLRLGYRFQEPPDQSRSVLTEVLDVRLMFPIVRATCRRTTTTPERVSETREFTVERDLDGFYVLDVLSRPCQLLFPLPLNVGDSWKDESGRQWMVRSLAGTVNVPAGQFTHCLLIQYYTGGDDGAGGEVAYAPGIGLVRRDFANEARAWSLELTARNVPDDVCVLHLDADRDAIGSPLIAGLRAAGWLVSGRSLRPSGVEDLSEFGDSHTPRHIVLIMSPALLSALLRASRREQLMASVKAVILHDLSLADAIRQWAALGEKLNAESREGVPRLVERLSTVLDVPAA